MPFGRKPKCRSNVERPSRAASGRPPCARSGATGAARRAATAARLPSRARSGRIGWWYGLVAASTFPPTRTRPSTPGSRPESAAVCRSRSAFFSPLREPVPALAESDEERVLQEPGARPREMEEDDEVAEIRFGKAPPVSARAAGAPHSAPSGRGRGRSPRRSSRGRNGARRRPIRRPASSRSRGTRPRPVREHGNLVEKAGHEVRGVRDAPVRREESRQGGVVLQGVQAHPRQRRGRSVERGRTTAGGSARGRKRAEAGRSRQSVLQNPERPAQVAPPAVRMPPPPGPRMSSGPARRSPPNRVRSGRKQHSGVRPGRRGSPGLIGGLGGSSSSSRAAAGPRR